MYKLAAVLLVLATPAFAEDKAVDAAALKDCPPIGQSAKGELIYGMDCRALKTENRVEVIPAAARLRVFTQPRPLADTERCLI